MTVFIDADGCPVVDITIRLTKKARIECVIVCDTSHIYEKPGIKNKTVIVSQGGDSVDFVLVNMVKKGDIVITQDYGLGAMCLARGAIPVSQDGLIYSDNNIDVLLHKRYMAKKIRMSGGKLKRSSKRTPEQDMLFEKTLTKLLLK